MKKPAPWQIVLLVIFYPVGIVYLILYLKSKNKNTTYIENQLSSDIVFVNKGSKVFHYDQMCAMSHTANAEEIKESKAIRLGLKPCKKCSGYK